MGNRITTFLFLFLILFFSEVGYAHNKEGSIPICYPPNGITSKISDEGKLILEIDDVTADPEGVRYQFRIKREGSVKQEYFSIFYGNQIEFDIPYWEIEKIEGRKICDGSFLTYSIASKWININIEQIFNFEVDTCLAFNYGYLTQQGDSTVVVNLEGPDPWEGYGYIFTYRFCNSQQIYRDTIAFYCVPDVDWNIYEGMSISNLCLFQITLLFGEGFLCENQPGGGGIDSSSIGTDHIDFDSSQYNICTTIIDIVGDPVNDPDDPNDPDPNDPDPNDPDPNDPDPNDPPGGGGSVDSSAIYNCGEEFDWNTSGNDPLTSLAVGDTIRAVGFPIVVTTVSASHGNGIFSGAGEVEMPFQRKVGAVEFNQIKLNTAKELINGDIFSFSSNSGEIDSIISNLTGFEATICNDPEEYENLSRPGFDENGYYTGESPPCPDTLGCLCDPNGFDVAGIHCLTGTIYNEEGCSVEGIDSLGNACDPTSDFPFYWHENGEGNTHGISLWEKVKDDFGGWVDSLLQDIKGQLVDSLNTVAGNCNQIRSSMNNIINQNNIDREFILGSNELYFSKGMHTFFTQPPKKLTFYDNTKDVDIIALEEEHVDLYHCDVKENIFDNLVDEIEFIITDGNTKDQLNAIITNRIKNFSEAEVEAFDIAPYESLQDWIKDFIKSWINIPNELLSIAPINDSYLHRFPHLIEEFSDFGFSTFNLGVSSFPYLSNTIGDMVLSSSNQNMINSGVIQLSPSQVELFTSNLSINSALLSPTSNPFPLKISKEINGREYAMYIDNLVISSSAAYIDIYFIFTVPESGESIAFKAAGVSITPNGPVTETKLSLVNSQEIRITNALKLRVNGDNKSFARFDCDGYAGMVLDVDLVVCRKYLIPLEEETFLPIEDEEILVATNLVMNISDWGNQLYTINLPPFAVTKYPHIGFQVKNATLDLSDLMSPQNAVFPEDYNSPYVINNKPIPLWQGIYIEKVDIVVREAEFQQDTITTPLWIEGTNFIFDDSGFSGTIEINYPIVDLETGNLGGWAFSVDGFLLSFVSNKLKEGGFWGKINIPLFHSKNGEGTISADDCVEYRAFILGDGGFSFSLQSLLPEYNIPFLIGSAKIVDGSSVFMEYSSSEGFLVSAHLSAEIEMSGGLSESSDIEMPFLKVENLILSNHPPYLRNAGYWSNSLEVGGKLGGFELGINNIGIGSKDSSDVCLSFGVNLGLGSGNLNLKAGGSFEIFGKVVETNGRQRWVYDDFKMRSFHIDADIKDKFSVKGNLYFFEDDPTFGNGFYGDLDLKLNFLSTDIGIAAAASFGRAPHPGQGGEFRYFYVDVLANLGSTGIPLGGINIVALRGGAYNRMIRNEAAASPLPEGKSNQSMNITAAGQTPSGISYLPDPDIGLGFLAGIHFTTVNERMINGNLVLEVSFNSSESDHSGIREISLKGSARILDLPVIGESFAFNDSLTPPDISGTFVANASFQFNFNKKEFSGYFEAYLNAGILQGVGSGGRVGRGEIYFGPSEWYVYVGTPSQPFGLKLGIGSLSITSKSYFCIGTVIPSMPPVNAKAQSIAGSIRDAGPQREGGRGMVFGSSFEFKTGDLRFLVFRAGFEAGLGFDVMFRDYGDLTCVNLNNQQIGLNGWYFTGQVWAYVDGHISIRFRGKNRPIIALAAGVIMQGGGPDPFYFSGRVGGSYKILGGLVKGKCNFKIDLGERCEPGEGFEEEFDIIADIYPPPGSSDIDVFDYPQAFFIGPIGEKLEIESLVEGDDDFYRFEIKSAKLSYNNMNLDGEIVESTFHLEFVPDWAMPSEDTLTFTVEVNVFKNNIFQETQSRSTTFTTGITPDIIPHSNIIATYPTDKMMNFYPKENNAEFGFIQLKTWQFELLNDPEYLKVHLSSSTGDYFEVPVEFDLISNLIKFPLSQEKLNPGEFYKISLRKYNNNSDIGNRSGGKGGEAGGGSGMEFSGLDYRELYSLSFKVSEYLTFRDKLDDLFNNGTVTTVPAFSGLANQYSIENFEGFDFIEINGNHYESPLIEVSIPIKSKEWYLSGFNMVYMAARDFAKSNENFYGSSFEIEIFSDYGPDFNPANRSYKFQLARIEVDPVPEQFSNFKPAKHIFSINTKALLTNDFKGILSILSENCNSDIDPGFQGNPTEYICSVNPEFINGLEMPSLNSVLIPVEFKYKIPNIGLTTRYTVSLDID